HDPGCGFRRHAAVVGKARNCFRQSVIASPLAEDSKRGVALVSLAAKNELGALFKARDVRLLVRLDKGLARFSIGACVELAKARENEVGRDDGRQVLYDDIRSGSVIAIAAQI